MSESSLCNSCGNLYCIFQSGINRIKCDFYVPKTYEEIYIKFIDTVGNFHWIRTKCEYIINGGIK